jgi:hypothetical protein
MAALVQCVVSVGVSGDKYGCQYVISYFKV